MATPSSAMRIEGVDGNVVRLAMDGDLLESSCEEMGFDFPPGLSPGVVPLTGNNTPLHDAADRDEARTIAKFRDRPEFINARDDEGRSPLFRAALKGKLRAVKALILLGVELETPHTDRTTPFSVACEQGHLDVVRELHSFGADMDSLSHNGTSELEGAAAFKRDSVVEFLLKAGARVNIHSAISLLRKLAASIS